MFEFIRGTLFHAENTRAVLDVHGVGYSLGISLNSFAKLPELGEEVLLFTHYHVTENSQALFGFYTKDERDLFEILISVNKVGPKVAISILSTLTVEQIVAAVENQDWGPFKACSGIGPKTAQRIVMELKGKMTGLSIDSSAVAHKAIQATKEKPLEQSIRDEAFTALIALGYSESQVRVALAKVEEEIDETAPVHEWITLALKVV